MNKNLKYYLLVIVCFFCVQYKLLGQDIKRERPKEWENLAKGGAFIDRFLPIPAMGELTSSTWGCDAVLPRYIENGIEESEWSYWGGNVIIGSDGLYHLFICRWPENNDKGHMLWTESEVVHTVSDNRLGPYRVVGQPIGKGHNPEIFRLEDGRYVIYVIDAYYISDSLNGPWEKDGFKFNSRNREIIEGLSNLSFVQREDGSYLMVCRGGGIWVSKTGISSYNQITNKSVYPSFDGRYEDPVIWRTGFQYHLIVNDWFGRIAYYLRSPDGINWKVEPGEAYTPGIAKYDDGTMEDWYKYERIKILQDEHGRAIQANFAVIDTLKRSDLGNDLHSSKNISIPLVKERLITILNGKKITGKTKFIKVEITSEDEFNAQTDIDIESLRFGASEAVNFGKGSKAVSSQKDGKDLMVVFNTEDNGLTEENFAAKLLGRTKTGKLLIGYAKLPGVKYVNSILSATKPVLVEGNGKKFLEFEVQNFGQIKSKPSKLLLEIKNEENTMVFKGKVKALKPFEKHIVQIENSKAEIINSADEINMELINSTQKLPLFSQKVNMKD